MLFLIIIAASFLVQLFAPWWSFVAVSFILSLALGKSARHAFFSAFLALSALWLVLTLIKSMPNDHLLAGRVASMVSLPGPFVLLLLVAVSGGIIAGLGAMSGYYVKTVLFTIKNT